MTAVPSLKRPRKARKPKEGPPADMEAVADILQRLMATQGRGSLTWFASEVGLSPSSALKRLSRPACGLDAITARALILIQKLRDTEPTDETTVTSGGYLITVRDGQPKWRRA